VLRLPEYCSAPIQASFQLDLAADVDFDCVGFYQGYVSVVMFCVCYAVLSLRACPAVPVLHAALGSTLGELGGAGVDIQQSRTAA
jgi:hypothetical protein